MVRVPELVTTQLAAFRSIDAAGGAVSAIVAAGIVPAAIEMMDSLTIEAAEAAFHPGYPEGAEAVLLVELDGVAAQVEDDTASVRAICEEQGAFAVREASDEDERALLWKGRKGAFPAMGRISPDYYVQDGVVPRTRLPEVLRRIERAVASEHGLRVGNVFHAGDGNLHPLVLYDAAAGRGGTGEGARRGDPGRLPRRRRVADGRARDRRRQGVRDAGDVLRGRPRGRSPASAARSTPRASPTRARSCPRHACAARCRGRTAHIRWRGPGLPTVSSLAEAAEHLARRRCRRAAACASART